MSRPPDPAAAAAADPVEAAFAAQPRAAFLPPEQRPYADHDGPLPIGHGQTNSQPRTVAAMLRLLEVAPGRLGAISRSDRTAEDGIDRRSACHDARQREREQRAERSAAQARHLWTASPSARAAESTSLAATSR